MTTSKPTRYAIVVKKLEPAPEITPEAVITISEAAARLKLDRQLVSSMMNNGQLTRVVDTSVTNPRYQYRALVAEVNAELNRRTNPTDKRLRKLGGRKRFKRVPAR